MCNSSQHSSSLLISFQPTVLRAPLDPQFNCRAYKVPVSCLLRVEVEEGQRILVKTGTEYQLGDLYCNSEYNKLKITFAFDTKTEQNAMF